MSVKEFHQIIKRGEPIAVELEKGIKRFTVNFSVNSFYLIDEEGDVHRNSVEVEVVAQFKGGRTQVVMREKFSGKFYSAMMLGSRSFSFEEMPQRIRILRLSNDPEKYNDQSFIFLHSVESS